MKISRLLLAILLCAAPLWASQAQTDYPTRPVRFLVPWPAGGLNDIIARSFNDKVSQSLGKQVITDFKAGAAGRIGVTEIAKAKPDGYTIGMGTLGPLTIFPSLYKQMPYSVKDLIDAAKAKPGVLNYASVGPGSPAHLTFELLKKRTGVDLLHVPFKGTNESLPAMFSGDIHAMFDTLPLALPHIQAGKLRALAVTTLQRVPQLPDVPTLKELSLGDDEVVTWYAVIAPAGTPQPIVDRLYKEYTAAAGTPEVKKMLTDNGLIYIPNTMAEFQARIAAETARWAQIIKENKLELDP